MPSFVYSPTIPETWFVLTRHNFDYPTYYLILKKIIWGPKKKNYAKLRLQNLKSQINTQQHNIQSLKKLNDTAFKVSNKYKINPLTHSDTVSTALTQIIIYLVKKRVKSMVLKTGPVKELKKRVVMNYLVGPRLDQWSNRWRHK